MQARASGGLVEHASHSAFIDAIHSCNKMMLGLWSQDDGYEIVRSCAPLDFGPGRYMPDGKPRYHFWDFDNDAGAHVLSLLHDRVITMDALPVHFDPSDVVKWDVTKSPWFVPRNWGRFS